MNRPSQVASSTKHETASDDLNALRLTVAEQNEHLDALRRRLDEMAERQVELRRLLMDAHRDLVRRDEELERFGAEMAEAIELKNGEIREVQAALSEAQRAIAAMERTRVWRTGQRFWRAKARIKRIRR